MKIVQTFLSLAVSVVIGFAAAGAAGASPSAPSQSFATCADAQAAGYSDIPQGSPGYAVVLDGDGDGIACDTDEPSAAPTTAEVLGTSVAAADAAATTPPPQAPPEVLANTGATSWILTAVALALVAAGYWLVRTGYEKLNWITGTKHTDVRYTALRSRRGRRR